jgi:hypothetical protein
MNDQFQSDVPTEPPTPGVVRFTYFSQSNVIMLTAADFSLKSKERVAIRYEDCMIVLFYGEDAESIALMKIFSLVGQEVRGPVFGAVNMLAEPSIARAFAQISQDGSSVFPWLKLQGYPFILVYRKGIPCAFYNGDLDINSIKDFAVAKACNADYYEYKQHAKGVYPSKNDLHVGKVKDGDNRKDSTEFIRGNPLRIIEGAGQGQAAQGQIPESQNTAGSGQGQSAQGQIPESQNTAGAASPPTRQEKVSAA